MTRRYPRCRCAELNDECPACRTEAARTEERDLGDPMLFGDYDRLEAGLWWGSVPA